METQFNFIEISLLPGSRDSPTWCTPKTRIGGKTALKLNIDNKIDIVELNKISERTQFDCHA